MKLLLYCTKAKPYLLCEPYMDENKPCRLLRTNIDKAIYNCAKENAVNGKIVAECDFEVEEIKKINYDCLLFTNTLNTESLINKSCIDYFELEDYLKPNWDKEDDLQNLHTVGYAIHIKNLHIFDEPKELSECHEIITVDDANFDENDYKYVPITKAPKNMTYTYDNEGNKYILIPIKPEEMCRIANKEQTVLVRKRVLKEMM